uniref:F-box protein At5g07610-like n=1 Tax=Erigeron canadensis TaxID=72917 RepID=UPI001CB980ED|nr:F-box protein At5g07610-like [Erigeron canadensis]
MESLVGGLPGNSVRHETVTTTLQTDNKETTLTSIRPTDTEHVIVSSQDLLTEIFNRLPVISVIQLMSVSKQWYFFIKSSSYFQNSDPGPPIGLFFEGWDARYKYRYVGLDIENSINRPPFTTLCFDSGAIKILQSCNGLLLCANDFQKYYVYNPTTNRFKTLPKLNNHNPDSTCCMTLAFDPSISSGYKVVCSYLYKVMTIEIYSSKTGRWKVLSECMDNLMDIERGVYGHNAIHWMSFPNRLVYLKLDEELLHYIDIDTPDTTIYGTILDEFLAESRDGMLLVVRCCRFRRLNVYAINKDYSEWYIKYHVDLEEVIRVYPKMMTRLGLHFLVQSLVLGEKEEDSYIVLELPGKLIQYKFVVNTITQLCDFTNESRRITQGGFFPKTIFQLSDFTPENRRFINGNCFHFIPSLTAV